MTKYDMKMMAGHPESSSDASKGIHSLSKELADSLLNESLCLVLGSEGNGLSSETLQACELVNIPMEGTRNVWELLLMEFLTMVVSRSFSVPLAL